MRISDWSSDVCSSDLAKAEPVGDQAGVRSGVPGQRPESSNHFATGRDNVSQLGLVIRPGPADPETNAFHAVVGKHREDIHTVAGEHEMWVGYLLHHAGKAEKVGEVEIGRAHV